MPALARQPVLYGLIYGVVVMLGMMLLLMAEHLGPPSDAASLVKSLIGHTVFFGLPVALYVQKAANA